MNHLVTSFLLVLFAFVSIAFVAISVSFISGYYERRNRSPLPALLTLLAIDFIATWLLIVYAA